MKWFQPHNHPSYYQVSYWVITLFKFSAWCKIEWVPNLSEEVLRQVALSPIFPIQQSYFALKAVKSPIQSESNVLDLLK